MIKSKHYFSIANELNFDNMTRDELAQYMVAHRNTPAAVAATRALIRQMAKRAESRGIDFYKSQPQSVDSSGLPVTEN